MTKLESEIRFEYLTGNDLQQWSELMSICAEADDHEELYEPEDLEERLASADFDPQEQSTAVWADDRLVGAATVDARREPRFDGRGQASIDIQIHPRWRGRGLEAELLDRSEMQGRRLVERRTRGIAYDLKLGVRPGESHVLFELNQRGYERVRVFLLFQRPVPLSV